MIDSFIVGDWLLFASCPPILIFTALYGLRSNWRRSAAGKAVLFLSASLSAVALLVALTLALGTDFPGRVHLRTVIYLAILVSNWYLLVVLVKIQVAEAHTIKEFENRLKEGEER